MKGKRMVKVQGHNYKRLRERVAIVAVPGGGIMVTQGRKFVGSVNGADLTKLTHGMLTPKWQGR